MRWVLSLVLLGTATLSAAGVPTSRAKHPSTAAVPKKASGKGKTAKAAGKASSKPAIKGSSRLVKAGRARGRSSAAIVHTPRVPPPPSYQLHPDPERYQQIQQALAERGYFKGEINGTWGDDSTDALRRFQADQKLPDDGKITALSLNGLGLGPRHDGSTASAVPLQPAPDPSPTTTALPPPESPPINW